MAAKFTIKGGPLLRARLDSVSAAGPEIKAAWATDAARRIKADAPTNRGVLKASVTAQTQGAKVGVWGAFWGIFVDRGTKAHDIKARKGGALRFEVAGRTIFTKKVHRKRMRRRPFITENAQEALAAAPLRDQIIGAWNRRRGKGRGGALSL